MNKKLSIVRTNDSRDGKPDGLTLLGDLVYHVDGLNERPIPEGLELTNGQCLTFNCADMRADDISIVQESEFTSRDLDPNGSVIVQITECGDHHHVSVLLPTELDVELETINRSAHPGKTADERQQESDDRFHREFESMFDGLAASAIFGSPFAGRRSRSSLPPALAALLGGGQMVQVVEIAIGRRPRSEAPADSESSTPES